MYMSGVGPMSRDVRDSAELLQIMAEPDLRDPWTFKDSPPDYLAALTKGVAGMTMAWTPDWGNFNHFFSDADSVCDAPVLETVHQTALRFREAGAQVDEIHLDFGADFLKAFESWFVINNADRYALLGHLVDDPTTRAVLSNHARHILEPGRSITGAEYALALRERQRFTNLLEQRMAGYDLILTPTTPYVAQKVEDMMSLVPTGIIQRYAYHTFMVNFTGFAAPLSARRVRGRPAGGPADHRPAEPGRQNNAGRQSPGGAAAVGGFPPLGVAPKTRMPRSADSLHAGRPGTDEV